MFKNSLLSIMLGALLLLLPTYLFSQTGPGGVGDATNQVLWLKPDAFSVADGTSIDSWDDDSGNINTLSQPDVAFRPIVKTNIVNGYDVVRFEVGNRRLRKTNFTTFPSTEISTFYINKTTDSGDGILSYNSAGRDNDYLLFNSGNLNYYRATNTTLNIDANDGNWHMVDMSWTNTGTGLFSYLDGALKKNVGFRNGNSITPGGSLALGAEQDAVDGSYADNQSHQGDFTEVIIFNEALSTAKRVIVQNYLTAKYGITLNSTVDFYTQDNAANGNFDHNVAGIGQATDGSNHIDSQGTGIVRINTPSALSNGDFLFWGEDIKDPSYAFVTNSSNYSDELNSKWRVSKVGDLGTVNVSFDISSMPIAVVCGGLQLVVDNDSDFSSPTSYNLTVSGTTATVSGVSFSDSDYFTLRYTDQIVWNGTAFFNGSGALNAPDNTDACLKLTVKSGNTAILTADAHIREVEVEPGAMLQVNDGVLLEVDNGIFNQGTIDLLGEAQLIQNHTGTSLNTGSGDLKIRQEGTFNLYNYNYWSAPVNRSGNWEVGYLETESGPIGFTGGYDANPSASPIELSSYWLYTFNDLIDNYYGWNHITPTTGVTPAMGYLMKGSGNATPTPMTDQTYVFKGTANDGDYSIPAISGNQVLVGNPYPSTMSAKEFINDNSSVIQGSIYLYEHFQENNTHILADYQGGYATRNNLTGVEAPSLPSTGNASSKGAPEDAVAVAQGFFVKIQSTGTVHFRNSQRVFARESLGESTFYRSAQSTPADDRIIFWLKFKDHQNNESTIALGYDTNASVGFDNGYDSESFNELPNEVYWPIIDKKMCIQGLNSFDVSDEIPLGIAISESGDFTFEIDRTLNFPTNETIYLKDSQTNTFYDIQSNPVTLNISDGESQSRFSIVYQTTESLSTDNFDADAAGLYYNVDKDALVFTTLNNVKNIETITIYNLLGQKVKVLEGVDSREVDLSFLKTGIYIAEINQDYGQKITLKFIKP
ncbi:T9SS type A sorting domain-containing protein [Olleya sp. HaHaR_3_96]|uniref:T9SS type A sorting domain-containing protein n=1 Tax=Olleya sp. HaHaR_3_96 TaxID=2745560 RepID=UPI001C4EC100|nr:T9SS type A sorting domain-containing protein [Olleya sp. HaHaR_3_96]QXP61394.1 T9SS type A sorting domain-containing protein [Olleya sp. HaHaR_3_96]